MRTEKNFFAQLSQSQFDLAVDGFPVQQAKLSLAASTLLRIHQAHERGREMDAGFDAGEFSGPSHTRTEAREIEFALDFYGYTPATFVRELESRTEGRWADCFCSAMLPSLGLRL